jgi:hypothetical protein
MIQTLPTVITIPSTQEESMKTKKIRCGNLNQHCYKSYFIKAGHGFEIGFLAGSKKILGSSI